MRCNNAQIAGKCCCFCCGKWRDVFPPAHMWGLFNDVENLFSLHFSDSFERFGKLFLGRVAITFWHNSLKIVSLAPVLFYRSREMKKPRMHPSKVLPKDETPRQRNGDSRSERRTTTRPIDETFSWATFLIFKWPRLRVSPVEMMVQPSPLPQLDQVL